MILYQTFVAGSLAKSVVCQICKCGCKLENQHGHIPFVEIGHEIVYTAILSLQLIQVGQLSVPVQKKIP